MAASHILGPKSFQKQCAAQPDITEMLRSPKRPAKRNNDDDNEVEEIPQPMMYQQYTATRLQNITNFYISDGVDEPKMYTDMIHRIRTAQPQDIIYLHFNTPGGRLDSGIQIINAINDSAARIVGVLDSKAYSLGTLIFLSCDEFVIHDNCMFMIHNYSGGTYGKGNEQHAEIQATIKWFTKIATRYYYPFLSHAEINQVLRGEDFWMDSDEVKKRLKNMVKIREEEAKGPKVKTNKKAKTATEPAAAGEAPAADGEAATEGTPAADVPATSTEKVTTTLPSRRRKGQGLNGGVLPPADVAAAASTEKK